MNNGKIIRRLKGIMTRNTDPIVDLYIVRLIEDLESEPEEIEIKSIGTSHLHSAGYKSKDCPGCVYEGVYKDSEEEECDRKVYTYQRIKNGVKQFHECFRELSETEIKRIPNKNWFDDLPTKEKTKLPEKLLASIDNDLIVDKINELIDFIGKNET